MKTDIVTITDSYKVDFFIEKLMENGLPDIKLFELRNHMTKIVVKVDDKESRIFNHVCNEVETHFKNQRHNG